MTVESMSGHGTGPFFADQRCAVLVHEAHGGLPLRGHGQEVGFVGNVEDVLDRVEQEVAVRLRHAEQETDGLHRELGRHVDQEVTLSVDRLDEPAHPAPQLLLQIADRRRRQTPGDQAADAGVPGVVHHVQDDPGHGEVLNDRASVGAVASGLRRVGHRVAEDLEHLVVGGHRPEALPVGSVHGGLVPPHRRLVPVEPEDVVRESVGKGIEIRQVHVAEVMHHGAILMTGPDWVKNGDQGA